MKNYLLLFLCGLMTFGSLQAQPVTCIAPAQAGAVLTGEVSARILWSLVRGAVSYNVQYKRPQDSVWNTSANVLASDTANLVLANLAACTEYQYRVRANCSATSSSAYTTQQAFRTGNCAPACRVPSNLFAVARDSAAVLYWAATNTGGFVIQYRVISNTNTVNPWTMVTAATPTYTLRGLLPCTYYEFQVKAVCSATSSSDYSASVRFKTTGCPPPCLSPRELRLTTSTAGTSITASWYRIAGVTGYGVQYKAATDSAWTSATTADSSLTINNLRTCTVYQVRVRTNCNATTYSEYSSSNGILTGGCPARCEAPRRLSITTITATSAVLRWDSLGTTYDVQYQGPRDTTWRSVAGVRGNTYTLTGLLACTGYYFRVRTVCSASSSAYSAPMRFNTTCTTVNCTNPRQIVAQVAFDTTAFISWTAVGATGITYNLQYRLDSVSAWISVNGLTAPQYQLTGLQRCRVYAVRVQTACAGTTNTTWTEPTRFQTRGCNPPAPGVCLRPVGLNIVVNGTTMLACHIRQGLNTTVNYTFQYRRAVDSAWISRSVGYGDTCFTISGLTTCTNYVARMRTNCGTAATNVSDWTEATFRTGGANCFGGDNGGDNSAYQSNGGGNSLFNTVSLSPNPGKDFVNVAYELNGSAQVRLDLVNLQGQVISSYDGGTQDAGAYMQTLDGLNDLTSGLYLLIVRADGQVTNTLKWLKN